MADILNQDEIDALLTSVGDDDGGNLFDNVGLADAGGGGGHDGGGSTSGGGFKKVSVYDFRRPDRVSKEQLRSIRNLHDKFARNFSSDLSSFLRTITDITLVSVDQMTYGEFLLSLPDPTSFNIISLIPLQGNAVLEVNPSLTFPIIDKLLGGQGMPLFQVRELTSLEQNIIDQIINLILKNLEDVWKQIVTNIRFKKEISENSPHVVQVVAQNEVAVLIVFEVHFGEATGMINLCIPAIVLEPILNKISSQDWMMGSKHGRSGEYELQIINLLADILVEFIVELGRVRLSVSKMLDLEPGDVILLSKKSDRPLNIYIKNKLKYYGELGVYGVKKAVKLTYMLTETDYEATD